MPSVLTGVAVAVLAAAAEDQVTLHRLGETFAVKEGVALTVSVGTGQAFADLTFAGRPTVFDLRFDSGTQVGGLTLFYGLRSSDVTLLVGEKKVPPAAIRIGEEASQRVRANHMFTLLTFTGVKVVSVLFDLTAEQQSAKTTLNYGSVQFDVSQRE